MFCVDWYYNRKADKSIDEGHWWSHSGIGQGDNYQFEGNHHWDDQQMITMKLNCNEWNVTWFRDNKQVQKEEITPNQSYYFTLFFCDKLRIHIYKLLKI